MLVLAVGSFVLFMTAAACHFPACIGTTTVHIFYYFQNPKKNTDSVAPQKLEINEPIKPITIEPIKSPAVSLESSFNFDTDGAFKSESLSLAEPLKIKSDDGSGLTINKTQPKLFAGSHPMLGVDKNSPLYSSLIDQPGFKPLPQSGLATNLNAPETDKRKIANDKKINCQKALDEWIDFKRVGVGNVGFSDSNDGSYCFKSTSVSQNNLNAKLGNLQKSCSHLIKISDGSSGQRTCLRLVSPDEVNTVNLGAAYDDVKRLYDNLELSLNIPPKPLAPSSSVISLDSKSKDLLTKEFKPDTTYLETPVALYGAKGEAPHSVLLSAPVSEDKSLKCAEEGKDFQKKYMCRKKLVSYFELPLGVKFQKKD
jgi:hypothetical protein